MIHRTLLLGVAVISALSSNVAAFSNAPARGPLKGAASPSSRAIPASHTSLYAVKKESTKKKTSTKKSAEKEPAPAPVAVAFVDEVVKFKKADFVSAVAEKTGMTKVQSDLALTAVLDVLATEVADGKKITLPGFGTFKLTYRAARKGRNPSTGEEIDIRALNIPSFSASKTFKEMCNPDR